MNLQKSGDFFELNEEQYSPYYKSENAVLMQDGIELSIDRIDSLSFKKEDVESMDLIKRFQ